MSHHRPHPSPAARRPPPIARPGPAAGAASPPPRGGRRRLLARVVVVVADDEDDDPRVLLFVVVRCRRRDRVGVARETPFLLPLPFLVIAFGMHFSEEYDRPTRRMSLRDAIDKARAR